MVKKDVGPLPSLVLEEFVDMNILSMLIQLKLSSADEKNIQLMDKSYTLKTRAKVEYFPGKYAEGRLYAAGGLQSTCGWMKRVLTEAIYHDIDIVNCGPTILSQIIRKNHLTCPIELLSYVNDREHCFDTIRNDCNSSQFLNHTNSELKAICIKVILGGGFKFTAPTTTYPNVFLDNLLKGMRVVLEALFNVHALKDLRRFVEDLPENKDKALYQLTAQFASYATQQIENQIILCLCSYFQKESRIVGFLSFDGLAVERMDVLEHGEASTPFDVRLLRSAELHTYKQLGYSFKLVEKSLIATDADRELLYGTRVLKKMPVNQHAAYKMWKYAHINKLSRIGEFIYKPHDTLPGVIVQHMSLEEYSRLVLIDLDSYSQGGDSKNSMAFLRSIAHPKFPIYEYASLGTTDISFLNGVFNITSLSFCPYDVYEETFGHPPKTNIWYFEQYFDKQVMQDTIDATSDPDTMWRFFDEKTPLWNQLLNYQLEREGDKSVCDALEVLIGRLFFPVGLHDKYQVMPFLLGDSATGKSTICNILTKTLPKSSVGHISATHEGNFGLESIYNKRLVIIPDMPKGFHKIINQSDFQSMLSGEGVSIARKNQLAVTDRAWTAPCFGAGNYIPSYEDNSGSISRRLVVFPFKNKVEQSDSGLEKKIIEYELIYIIVKCITKYLLMVEGPGADKMYWDIAPQMLKETKEQVSKESNHLAAFLTDGDEFYQIVHDEDSITSVEELGQAFSNHMRIRHKQQNVVLGNDRFPIKNAGFVIKRVQLCKTCGGKHIKQTCGSHYNSKNRLYRERIIGMKIIKKERPPIHQEFHPY